MKRKFFKRVKTLSPFWDKINLSHSSPLQVTVDESTHFKFLLLNSFSRSVSSVLFVLFLSSNAFAQELDQKKFEQALARYADKFTCQTCKPEHLKLLKKAKMNEKAIRLKFLNILESGPSGNRLLEYTTKASIQKVEDFLAAHQGELCSTYKKTKVDPMVLTSLLYMETLFGSEDIPWFKALNSNISLAVLEDDAFADHVIEVLKPRFKRYKRYRKNPTKWNNYDWKKRAKWIAGDWDRHVKAYLQIASMQNWSDQKVLDMKSSWAGAIGYSQFMPGTALPYFKEQSNLNFWQWPDSFELTSMYLRDKGFAKDKNKALQSYNSPKWYRDTIMHLSFIMDKKNPNFCTAQKHSGS